MMVTGQKRIHFDLPLPQNNPIVIIHVSLEIIHLRYSLRQRLLTVSLLAPYSIQSTSS